MLTKRLCVAATLATVGLAASDASAFCRTRTVAVPADYDASLAGCRLEGVPLFWQNACVGYSIFRAGSKKIAYEEAANGISQAFTRWTGATCPADPKTGRTRVSIDVRDLGPADCAKIEYVSGAANQNVILFRDESWTHGKQVLGLTTVRFSKDNGEIFGADMELNTFDMDPLAVRDPVQPNEYDFVSVTTHEAGHFLGMGHSDQTASTMFARYLPGQTVQRNLTPDDIEAVCSVYRPDGERTVLNAQVLAAPQCDPTPRGGYSTQCEEPACSVIASGASTCGTKYMLGALGLAALAVSRRRRSRCSAR